jgi:NAD(P)H-hydrate epimerase
MINTKSLVDMDVALLIPPRENGRDINKGSFGHAMAFCGSQGFAGAAILTAEAAARTGAGLVTLALPAEIHAQVVSRISPAIMTCGLSSSPVGGFSKLAFTEALALSKNAKAAAIGPGLGTGDDVAAFTREFIRRCPVSLVIDADALNLLSLEPDQGESLLKSRKQSTILTPHPGEMGRLLGIPTESVQKDRIKALQWAVKRYDCVVLLKGENTLTTSPGKIIYRNPTGNPGMSTGGAGDVLTGVITGLLAQHLDPLHAAVVGAYIHGKAGDLFQQQTGGCTGLIATDLISLLPKALAECQRKESFHPAL